MSDLVNRLRGIYTVKVDDGAGLLDGKDTYTRVFDELPPIHGEAANRIEELESKLAQAEREKDEWRKTADVRYVAITQLAGKLIDAPWRPAMPKSDREIVAANGFLERGHGGLRVRSDIRLSELLAALAAARTDERLKVLVELLPPQVAAIRAAEHARCVRLLSKYFAAHDPHAIVEQVTEYLRRNPPKSEE